jgi:GTP-binding protein
MSRLPTLAIVGRPNVGKSTLFNRIVGRRLAVVEDSPGVTRDRLYARAEHKDRAFQVVDTGGILFSDDDPLIEQIRVQAEVAMAEADVILFVVDAGEGLNPADWELAERLRGVDQPVYVLVNKVDADNREPLVGEFYSLGFHEVVPVSGLHGRGVGEALQQVLDAVQAVPQEQLGPEGMRIALVGRPNVGKSSILNALTGEQRAIVSNIPGTTRDAIDTEIIYKNERVRLIDTAGIRRRGKIQGSVEYYMVLRATRAMQRADCALVLIDGEEGLTDGDKRVAKSAHDLGKPTVFAVNKWDLREPPDGNLGRSSPIKKDFLRILRNEVPELSYAPVRFTSAQESTGLDGILNAVRMSIENWRHRIPTGPLNRLVKDATFDKPLVRKGKAFKVYYTTQPQIEPPTIILFCNDPGLMHFSYKRFLENQIRKEFPLEGTPIHLFARASRDTEDMRS